MHSNTPKIITIILLALIVFVAGAVIKNPNNFLAQTVIYRDVFRTITEYLTVETPVQCPECSRAAEICFINVDDNADLDGNANLRYACRPGDCRIDAVAGSIDPKIGETTSPLYSGIGEGEVKINIGASSAIIYKLYRDGAQCASDIAHGFPAQSSGSISQTFTQSGYRWFSNIDSTDVGAAEAPLNTPFTSSGLVRLRLLIHVGQTELSLSGQSFKLQVARKGATCAASTYSDIPSADFAFQDNTTPSDGQALTSNANDPTHGSHAVLDQNYEEANNFTNSIAAIPASADGMWDFFIEGIGPELTYCFRVVKANGDLIGYDQYPEVTTFLGG